MEKKRLKINAGCIDLTDINIEALSAYESIAMNCGLALVSPKNRKLLTQLGVEINAGATLDLPDGVNVLMSDGEYELRADTQVPENSVLLVNGTMRIHPGAQDNRIRFVKIILNGTLIAPESMRGEMGNLVINGSQVFYPDEAEYVEGALQVNRRFARQAKENAVFFTTELATLTDENVDVDGLLEKNVIIYAKKAYIAASYPDGEMLFSSKTPVEMLPEGYAFVQGNLSIDAATARNEGKKIFVVGNVQADENAAEGLQALEGIIVRGTAKVHEDVLPLWQERCVKADKVVVIDKSRRIENVDAPVIIGREMLEMCEFGLRVANCNVVEILPEVEAALLSKKLLSMSCVPVCQCTKEQQGVLQLVSRDVNFVQKIPAEETEKEDDNVVTINAGSYKL